MPGRGTGSRAAGRWPCRPSGGASHGDGGWGRAHTPGLHTDDGVDGKIGETRPAVGSVVGDIQRSCLIIVDS